MTTSTEAIWNAFDARLRRFVLKHAPEDTAEDILQDVYATTT